jgi:hypothetical protein
MKVSLCKQKQNQVYILWHYGMFNSVEKKKKNTWVLFQETFCPYILLSETQTMECRPFPLPLLYLPENL